MAELFKITKKKKLITLFILKLISYLSSFGVSFAYAKYITSPLTADKLKCLITSLIILFFISLISNYFCTKIHELFIVDLKYDIELYYFKQLDNIDFNNLNDMHTGFIYNLIDKTAFSFYRIIDGFLECYLPLIIGICAFIYMTLKQSFLLGIISLVIFIIAVITRYIMTKDREKIRKELHRKHSLYTGSFIDFASNILTVKKLRIEKFAKDTLRKKADDFYSDLQICEIKQANIHTIFEILIDSVYIIILLAILNDIRQGVDALPFLIFYISIMGKITSSLRSITRTVELTLRFKNDKLLLTEAIGYLRYSKQVTFNSLEIINGIFSYKNKPLQIRIPHFLMKKGDKVSVMGESGQGKSTILNILAGFYELNEGTLLVNGEEICNELVKPVFISQEVELFDLSIRDNLCLGKQIHQKKLERLLKDAGLYEWYLSLPNGLDELVGEKGVKLSMGQKQRLNIIRGILIDADLYFFDEPTSNLDNYSEEKIYKMIEKYLKDKSYVIVTHRANLKRLCDKHYEFKNHIMKEVNYGKVSRN